MNLPGPASGGVRWARSAVLLPTMVVALLSAGYFLAMELVNIGVGGDAPWYATATPAWRGEQPLYPREWLDTHVAAYPLGFNLPPAAAIFGPVASLGPVVWVVLMAAVLLAGLAVLWPRLPDPWDLLLVCGLVAYWPIWSSLIWANINAVVFLLLAVAYRWPRQAGWAIGAAAAIKVSPILLLAVLVGRREWRQLVTALATGAGLSLLVVVPTGFGTLVDFVRVQLHESHPPLDYGWSAEELLTPAGALVLALVLAGVAVARGGAWGWAVAATLVLVPTLWVHYWLWALVPFLGSLRARYGGVPATAGRRGSLARGAAPGGVTDRAQSSPRENADSRSRRE